MAIENPNAPMLNADSNANVSIIVREETPVGITGRVWNAIKGAVKNGFVTGAVGAATGAAMGAAGGYVAGDAVADVADAAQDGRLTQAFNDHITELQAQEQTAYVQDQIKGLERARDSLSNFVNQQSELLDAVKDSATTYGAIGGAVTGGTAIGVGGAVAGAATGAIKGAWTGKIVQERQIAQQLGGEEKTIG